jgi:hypothetical protein
LIALSTVYLSACGSDDENLFGGESTEVREISLEDETIQRGEGTIMKVNFSFDQNDVFFDDGDVNLVIRLPSGIGFRPSSSEIDASGSNDDGVEPQLFSCPTGETYLLFAMDRFDLDNAAAPGDGADAQMKLTVDGESRGANLVIEARADEGRIIFGCNQLFIPDEQTSITVR